jgi:hypothetical protein
MYRELTQRFLAGDLCSSSPVTGPGSVRGDIFETYSEETMVTIRDLEAFFANGWNRHDVDFLMTFMSDDGVFEGAAGSEVCGTRMLDASG